MLSRILICVLIVSLYGCQSHNDKKPLKQKPVKEEPVTLIESPKEELSTKEQVESSPSDDREEHPFVAFSDPDIFKKHWKDIKITLHKEKEFNKERYGCVISDNDYDSYKNYWVYKCFVNNQYAVVELEGSIMEGVICVFKAFDRRLDEVTIDFSKVLYTYSYLNFEDSPRIYGVYENYLFIDTTSEGTSDAIIVDLNSGEIILNRGFIITPTFDGTIFTYWVSSDKKAKDICPNIEHLDYHSVGERVRFNVKTLKREKTGIFDCYFVQ